MKPEARESTDAAQVARLLKPPAERELPGSRHRQLKEYLMQEITHEAYETQASVKPRRSRRRLAYLVTPLAAAGAVAVFVAATADTSTNTGNNGHGNASGSSGLAAPPGSTAPANAPTALLGKIADAAASKPLPAVRDDQFVYVDSKVSFEQDTQDSTGYHSTLAPLHDRKIWLSVNGSQSGELRESGADTPLGPNPSPGINDPDYRYLAALPTDPAKLLDKIYADTRNEGQSAGPDGEAFTTIGDLLREQIAPPNVTAALYKAAAMIPGVRVIDNVVDVTGRHNIAVARDNSAATNEWLFNKSSLEFTGEQDVSLKAGPLGPAGTIVGTQIIVDRAIVDRVGEVPAK